MKRPCRIVGVPILAAAFLGCNGGEEPAKPAARPVEPAKSAQAEPPVRDMKPAEPEPESPAARPADDLPELAPPAGSKNEAPTPKPK